MKNQFKKLFLLVSLCGSILLNSCEKFNTESISGLENFNKLYENEDFRNNLDNNLIYDLNLIEFEVIDESKTIYNLPVKLKNTSKSGSIETSKLTIHTDVSNQKALIMLVSEKSTSLNAKEISYRYFENLEKIADFSFQNEDLIDFVPNCPSGSDGCFGCVMQYLGNDFIGFLACVSQPWSCALAAYIYCTYEIQNNHGVYNL